MSPHEVVDWQLECGQIRQRAAHLLSSGLWVDCNFLLGPDKVPVKAHKLILAMASPVFQAMFYGPMAEGNAPISIPDIQPDVFMKVLQYVYTDDIDLDNYIIGFELYYAAQKYMLPHLQTVCTAYLSGNLVPQNACRIYEFAELIGDEELRTESLKVLKAETKLALADSSFEELALDTVVKIFSMSDISIYNELVLFEAAERYYLASQKKSEQNFINALLSDPENDSAANTEHDIESDEACNAKVNDNSRNHSENNNEEDSPDTNINHNKESDEASNAKIPDSTGNHIENNNKKDIPENEEQSSRNYEGDKSYATRCVLGEAEIYENFKRMWRKKALSALAVINENDKEESTPCNCRKDKPVFVFNGKRDSVHKLIKPIRFLTLTAKELADYKPKSSLLTPNNILALMMNIASTETYMTLPDGFSTCRERRIYEL